MIQDNFSQFCILIVYNEYLKISIKRGQRRSRTSGWEFSAFWNRLSGYEGGQKNK